jgi:tetratricopeptide (TPR) repeat protein
MSMRIVCAGLLGMVTMACAPVCLPICAQVKVWEGTMTLPTYDEGNPDPNPPFDVYGTTTFSYPYTLRKNLTAQKSDHVWRAVYLENEYLKCSVLPDIGGHVYTCLDKISGQSMFYANPSIKKAEIGYRGAWAAFGIEFNFPVSHNWVSMSPVDYSYATNPDGSGSIWVGNIDRVYGMQWRVELVLRPGSALLEEKVTLYNRSDVRHRYYWWNNAGIQVWDDSKIEYPMQFVASHGFTEVRRWPVGPDGVDLSVMKNQLDGPMSYFIHGSHEPFMGIWNPRTKTGTVHFSEYSELPGKKIWTWGSDAEGLGWRKSLSDNNSAYVEVQAGLFRNQETYAFLDPGQVIRFSEFWMPVRGTGGISRANKVGVVKLDARGKDVTAALNVNIAIGGAQLRLVQSGKILWSEEADLTPQTTWTHTVTVKETSAKVGFELRDHAGTVLLSQTDGAYDWDRESTIDIGPQKLFEIPSAEKRTEDEWLKLAADHEMLGKTLLALETYTQAMTKHPESLTLAMARGRLAASLLHFEEAKKLLVEAQKRDTPNAELAYYLGIAEDGLGHTREALTAYSVAYKQATFRARAAARMGALMARQGDLLQARRYLNDAVEAAPLDIRSREEQEAVARASGDAVEADRLANEGLRMDPTSDFLKEEIGKADLRHLAADPYRVLRAATEYIELGLYARALSVVERKYPAVAADESEPNTALPQANPLVMYYAAFCKAKLGSGTARDWQAASKLSASYVFPSTAMDRSVLEAAVAGDASDATAQYLLGTLLFSKGLYDDGIAHWVEAKRLNPKMPILDADLGKAWLQLKGDVPRALESYREGSLNDATNEEIYAGLDEAMSLQGVAAKERAEALGRYPGVNASSLAATMPANLVYQLAVTRAEADQYESALALFLGRFFPSAENGVNATQVLFEIGLMQAEAAAKTGRCDEVKAFVATPHPGFAINGAVSQAYLREAVMAKACAMPSKAEELLKEAASSKVNADAAWAAKAQRMLGATDEAVQKAKLETALASADRVKDTSSFTGWWWYNLGTMEQALGRKEQAAAAFRKALLLPDSMMSHHMSRVALADGL